MQLDSVRSLKASVQANLVAPLSVTGVGRRALALAAQPVGNLAGPRRTVATMGMDRTEVI